jgi:hypothetical protein
MVGGCGSFGRAFLIKDTIRYLLRQAFYFATGSSNGIQF